MKLSSYPTVGFGTSRTYSSPKLWMYKYVKFWPSQNCIDFSSRMALQKWGHRFMQEKKLRKSAYQECCILNPLQQILPQKG
jgi:hypothetical protein